jgi:hypothetical protein
MTGLLGNEDSGWLGVENNTLLDDSDPNMGKAREMA